MGEQELLQHLALFSMNQKNTGEEDNTKTSYSQMFMPRIHLTENEQKPFNSNLRKVLLIG